MLFRFQCFSCLLTLPSLPFPGCHPYRLATHVLRFYQSCFSLFLLVSFLPSAFCHHFPTLFYFHLSALSPSGLVPHLFAYLCLTCSGCCYSCCPSPYSACSHHVLSVLSSVLLPIGPRLSLFDTSVDFLCFCCSCLVTASSAFPIPGCSPLLISCPQVQRPSLRHIYYCSRSATKRQFPWSSSEASLQSQGPLLYHRKLRFGFFKLRHADKPTGPLLKFHARDLFLLPPLVQPF